MFPLSLRTGLTKAAYPNFIRRWLNMTLSSLWRSMKKRSRRVKRTKQRNRQKIAPISWRMTNQRRKKLLLKALKASLKMYGELRKEGDK